MSCLLVISAIAFVAFWLGWLAHAMLDRAALLDEESHRGDWA